MVLGYDKFITNNENFITTDNKQFYVRSSDNSQYIKVDTFYNKAEMIVVDKTNYLEKRTTLYGIFRDDVNPLSFNMELEVDVPINFNYAYLEVFNRYYTVDNVTYINNKLARVSFSVDVLFSFKDAILKQKGFIDRNENGREIIWDNIKYQTPLVDNKNIVFEGYEMQEISLDNKVFYNQDGSEKIGDFVITGLVIGQQQ